MAGTFASRRVQGIFRLINCVGGIRELRVGKVSGVVQMDDAALFLTLELLELHEGGTLD